MLLAGIGGFSRQYVVVGEVLTGYGEDDSESGENNENGNNGGGDNGKDNGNEDNGGAQDTFELKEAVRCNQSVVANYGDEEMPEHMYIDNDTPDVFNVLLGLFDRIKNAINLFDKETEKYFCVKKAVSDDDYHYPEEKFSSAHQAAIAFTLTYKNSGQDAIGAIYQTSNGWYFGKSYVLPTITDDDEQNNKATDAVKIKISEFMNEQGFHAVITTNNLDVQINASRYYIDEDRTMFFNK